MSSVLGVGSSHRNHQDRGHASPAARAYLDRVEIDNRSIFVGNVPAGTTEHEIMGLFGGYGTIDKITIKDVFSKYERRSSSSPLRALSDILEAEERIYFAFVQFRSGITADSIVESRVRTSSKSTWFRISSQYLALFFPKWQDSPRCPQELR
jgi:hypothetical protein